MQVYDHIYDCRHMIYRYMISNIWLSNIWTHILTPIYDFNHMINHMVHERNSETWVWRPIYASDIWLCTHIWVHTYDSHIWEHYKIIYRFPMRWSSNLLNRNAFFWTENAHPVGVFSKRKNTHWVFAFFADINGVGGGGVDERSQRSERSQWQWSLYERSLYEGVFNCFLFP
jgi:hypothetical protein